MNRKSFTSYFFLLTSSSLLFADVEVGKALYEKKCLQCHGAEGAGDGPAAEFLQPRPRNFTGGVYKIRSTPSGALPTDEDLLKIITDGMPGTAMPSWEVLSEKEKRGLVEYIKTFSERFQTEKSTAIAISHPPRSTKEIIGKGAKLYAEMRCNACHGEQGRGDGPSAPSLEDEWGFKIRPANLTKGWLFRGGMRPEDIYRTLYTGVSGTPMPSFAEAFENPKEAEEKLWNLAHFIRSILREKPNISQVVKARRIPGELPKSSEDSLWSQAEAVDFHLVGQIITEPKLFTPSIDLVTVKALYNEKEIAILISWDDRTKSFPEEREDETPLLADALSVQFPAGSFGNEEELPYFLGGDEAHPVHILSWRSDKEDVSEQTGKGLMKVEIQPKASQTTTAAATYRAGQWHLFLKRPLKSDEQRPHESPLAGDVQFEAGQFVPIAFSAWDGHEQNEGSKRAVSSWNYIFLEPPTPMKVYAFPPVMAGLVFGLEMFLLARLHRRNQ